LRAAWTGGRGAGGVDEAIAYAAAIGAGYVHVMAGKTDPDQAGRARETFLAALDFAASAAERVGVEIVVEPLNAGDVPGYFLSTSDAAAEIVEELGRVNVKILFDCYHTQVSEGI
jgi:hydroxypyruvate isomerase